MKFSNSDIIRITQLKQYLLDPPYTFRLYTEANTVLQEATDIFSRYPSIDVSFYDSMEVVKREIEEGKNDKNKLRAALQQAGRLIGTLQSR